MRSEKVVVLLTYKDLCMLSKVELEAEYEIMLKNWMP